jgi:hypothetical protein
MAATTQAPIKVRLETKDKIRCLAAFEDAIQAEIVEAVGLICHHSAMSAARTDNTRLVAEPSRPCGR